MDSNSNSNVQRLRRELQEAEAAELAAVAQRYVAQRGPSQRDNVLAACGVAESESGGPRERKRRNEEPDRELILSPQRQAFPRNEEPPTDLSPHVLLTTLEELQRKLTDLREAVSSSRRLLSDELCTLRRELRTYTREALRHTAEDYRSCKRRN